MDLTDLVGTDIFDDDEFVGVVTGFKFMNNRLTIFAATDFDYEDEPDDPTREPFPVDENGHVKTPDTRPFYTVMGGKS